MGPTPAPSPSAAFASLPQTAGGRRPSSVTCISNGACVAEGRPPRKPLLGTPLLMKHSACPQGVSSLSLECQIICPRRLPCAHSAGRSIMSLFTSVTTQGLEPHPHSTPGSSGPTPSRWSLTPPLCDGEDLPRPALGQTRIRPLPQIPTLVPHTYFTKTLK